MEPESIILSIELRDPKAVQKYNKKTNAKTQPLRMFGCCTVARIE
ncbi:MAG: hypothetical protein BWY72_02119 [Bacteroidetes bacterium ADurb.Bin416]|nr:MAG: hypothetical protein BWY72_02119 [Bacteroidetes bacterium ADurb.Bin416]